jgi:microcystin-dependent protein
VVLNTASATTGITLGNTGSNTPHNNMPPVLAVNFIIKT